MISGKGTLILKNGAAVTPEKGDCRTARVLCTAHTASDPSLFRGLSQGTAAEADVSDGGMAARKPPGHAHGTTRAAKRFFRRPDTAARSCKDRFCRIFDIASLSVSCIAFPLTVKPSTAVIIYHNSIGNGNHFGNCPIRITLKRYGDRSVRCDDGTGRPVHALRQIRGDRDRFPSV